MAWNGSALRRFVTHSSQWHLCFAAVRDQWRRLIAAQIEDKPGNRKQNAKPRKISKPKWTILSDPVRSRFCQRRIVHITQGHIWLFRVILEITRSHFGPCFMYFKWYCVRQAITAKGVLLYCVQCVTQRYFCKDISYIYSVVLWIFFPK